MKKIILLTAMVSVCFSCNTVMETLYGVNKHVFFSSKDAAATHFHKKNNLEKEKIFFFTKEKDRVDFLVNDEHGAYLPYYALMINDSVRVDDSAAGDKRCIGVVDKFVLNYDKSKATYRPLDLGDLNITNYKGEPLDLNTANPTVVFVVDSNFGRILNATVNYVTGHIKEEGKQINYVYISTDYIAENDVANR
ncbi:hypothetical protein OGH69_10265 [Flavobacterium sp. MFBS3-15]|uniref:hypothetical protein n=1 Tax=Flavobacterium sp. MFBS3-15 TaxID=2989816 RepID=UPI002236AD0F|nr:hypothetical protein [Flavobacterium sp. MFBS3-15]MCW4469349.1 hypothetical protein [Flavobacterium sp. MFBS3-15]